MRPRNWWIISAAALAAERLVDATKAKLCFCKNNKRSIIKLRKQRQRQRRQQQGRHIAHKFVIGWEVGVIMAFDKTTRTLAGVSTEV